MHNKNLVLRKRPVKDNHYGRPSTGICDSCGALSETLSPAKTVNYDCTICWGCGVFEAEHCRLPDNDEIAANFGDVESSNPKRKSSWEGIVWDRKRSLWVATCVHEGEVINVGSFKTESEAAVVINRKCTQLRIMPQCRENTVSNADSFPEPAGKGSGLRRAFPLASKRITPTPSSVENKIRPFGKGYAMQIAFDKQQPDVQIGDRESHNVKRVTVISLLDDEDEYSSRSSRTDRRLRSRSPDRYCNQKKEDPDYYPKQNSTRSKKKNSTATGVFTCPYPEYQPQGWERDDTNSIQYKPLVQALAPMVPYVARLIQKELRKQPIGLTKNRGIYMLNRRDAHKLITQKQKRKMKRNKRRKKSRKTVK